MPLAAHLSRTGHAHGQNCVSYDGELKIGVAEIALACDAVIDEEKERCETWRPRITGQEKYSSV